MPDLHPRFWELPLKQLTREEWEALCDGCGKCCLNKLEDEDTGQVELTCVACRLFDDATALCSRYATRHEHVPECIVLTAEDLPRHLYWLPLTCAYHRAGASARGITLNEVEVSDEDWEDHIIEEPLGDPE